MALILRTAAAAGGHTEAGRNGGEDTRCNGGLADGLSLRRAHRELCPDKTKPARGGAGFDEGKKTGRLRYFFPAGATAGSGMARRPDCMRSIFIS